MWPILYDRWTEEVPLTPQALAQRFAENVRTPRTYREHFAALFKKETNAKPFEGVVQTDHFKIYRLIHYRNSFLPLITGQLDPTASGTRLTITMRLHMFVAAFMIFWTASVAAGAVALLRAAAQHQGRNDFAAAAIPFGMILFLAVLSISCFEIERRKARKLLWTIVHSDKTPPAADLS